MVIDPTVSFKKRIDWSTFNVGITIPVKCHKCFLSHLTIPWLKPGKSHPIKIKIGTSGVVITEN
jgi:hypothetical protein